jgi:hypothetical protein
MPLKADEDLAVAVVDDRNRSKSFRFLKNLFSVRNFSDKEFYLIDVDDLVETIFKLFFLCL